MSLYKRGFSLLSVSSGFLMSMICMCSSTRANEDAIKFYSYRSLIYSDYLAKFTKNSQQSPSVWGALKYSGSDALSQIEACADSKKEFCVSVPGLFQFSYKCMDMRAGATWEKNGWSYSIEKKLMVNDEYFIKAKGQVELMKPTDVEWNFVLSKKRGVTSLAMIESVGSYGEKRAKIIWHSIGNGFGAIDHACLDNSAK